VWFNRQSTADCLFAAFQQSKKELPSSMWLTAASYDVYLSRELKSDDMGSLSDRLDELMTEWIRLWKEFGGLKALAPK
jgi:hypothetical protein